MKSGRWLLAMPLVLLRPEVLQHLGASLSETGGTIGMREEKVGGVCLMCFSIGAERDPGSVPGERADFVADKPADATDGKEGGRSKHVSAWMRNPVGNRLGNLALLGHRAHQFSPARINALVILPGKQTLCPRRLAMPSPKNVDSA